MIYRVEGADGYELCHPVDTGEFEGIRAAVVGEPLSEVWVPPRMQIIREEHDGAALKRSHAPWLGSSTLVFRREVLDALGPHMLTYGEFLSLECDDADVVLYNPLRVLKALDEEASSVHRFDDGRILAVMRIAFKDEVVAGVDIFKLAELTPSPVFVSPRFVELWRSHGLVGLDFVTGGPV